MNPVNPVNPGYPARDELAASFTDPAGAVALLRM